jgi:hypothetical protein
MLLAIVAAGLLASSPALAVKEYVSVGSFASEKGAKNGEFSGPTGVAVNDSLGGPTAGDVYVLDKGNDRVEWFNASGSELKGQLNGSETKAKAFLSPGGIALDDSTEPLDPSKGDLYVADVGHQVIDKFGPEGKLLQEIGPPSLLEVHGLAVDSSGDLWVAEVPIKTVAEAVVDEFSPAGTLLKAVTLKGRGFTGESAFGLGIDSVDNLYLDTPFFGAIVGKFSAQTGEELAEYEHPEGAQSLAVDRSTNALLIDYEQEGASKLALFGPFGEPRQTPVQTFPASGLSQSHGVAVSGITETVYASQVAAADVEVFRRLIFPSVTTEGPSDIGEIGATLRGAVDPEGEPVTGCEIEYGPSAAEPGSYPNKASCVPAPPLAGNAPIQVSASATGLESRHTYHYRVTAINKNGSRSGGDHSFYTVAQPSIGGETVLTVGAHEATLAAQINAGGLSTNYSVEFGESTSYGFDTPSPPASLGAPQTPGEVRVSLANLEANHEYHFRFAATNAFAPAGVFGTDLSFRTPAASVASGGATCPNSTFAGFSTSLPDCRAYELVSSETGEVNVPRNLISQVESGFTTADVSTGLPFQAAMDGSSVTFPASSPTVGGNGHAGLEAGVQFVASRDASHGRWGVTTISPPASEIERAELRNPGYQGFSPALSVGVFDSVSIAFAASTSPPGPKGCEDVLYARSASVSGGNEYHPLFTETQIPKDCGDVERTQLPRSLLFAGGNTGAGQIPEYSDRLLQTPAPLTAGSTASAPGEGNNLYDSTVTGVYSVNVLPNGEQAPSSVFGAQALSPHISFPDFWNVISADGSRVFWTDLDTSVSLENPGGRTRLFVREDPASSSASTVQIDASQAPEGSGPKEAEERQLRSGGGRYWRASHDGSKVLFTDESPLTEGSTAEAGAPNLYQYDFGAPPGRRLTDLTAQPAANVQGVVGASEDGSYVYFVASGALASEPNGNNEKPTQRTCQEAEGEEFEGRLPVGFGCNLYLWRAGQPLRFIATLAAKDDNFRREEESNSIQLGDWVPDLGSRMAQATPDGHSLVFESTQRLTGYDNSSLGRLAAIIKDSRGASDGEVFIYNSDALPTKRLVCASCAPNGAAPVPLRAGTSYLPVSIRPTSMHRWISADGSRVFFDTFQPLVEQDTNGTQDVYEWEREGTVGCPTATSVWGGCVFLLSGGNTSDLSFLIETDATGENVFFVHRGQLAGVGEPNDRAELFDARVNGGFPRVSLACTGTGCQGVPPTGPTFATPASVTFSGAGNYPTPLPPTPSKPTKCTKGKARAHGKCIRRKVKKKSHLTRRGGHSTRKTPKPNRRRKP